MVFETSQSTSADGCHGYRLSSLQFDQVCKIVEVLGIPPTHVLEKASRTEKFFERGPGGNWMLQRPRDGRKVSVCDL